MSIVMPCLNEHETVGVCVREGFRALASGGMVGEVIVADNGSTDGSIEIATSSAPGSFRCRAAGTVTHCSAASKPPAGAT